MQWVVINGSFSNWNLLKSGFPQGSILGPILFLVHTDDFPNAISHCTLAMFADDSESLKVFQNVNCSDFTAIQGDLDGLTNKSLTNEIYLQSPKCLNLRILRKQISPERLYSILGTELNVVRSATDLGVIVSDDLKWTDHISSVLAKANCMMDFIKHNCIKDLKRDLLKTLHLSLVRSHLFYTFQL